MPKRKSYGRRRMAKKRGVKRRRMVRRRYRVRGSKLVCKRTFWKEAWIPTSTVTSGFWRYYTFTFGELPSSPEFAALYDQYKINRIKVTFRPKADNFSGNDTTDTTIPGVTAAPRLYAHVIVDPQSNVAANGLYTSANLNSFLENGNVRTYSGTRSFSVYFRPVVGQALSGNADTFGQFKRSPYCNTSVTNITHRGFHIFLQDFNLSGQFANQFDVFYTYYMSFRSLR